MFCDNSPNAAPLQPAIIALVLPDIHHLDFVADIALQGKLISDRSHLSTCFFFIPIQSVCATPMQFVTILSQTSDHSRQSIFTF
jgi:hypothetical protein